MLFKTPLAKVLPYFLVLSFASAGTVIAEAPAEADPASLVTVQLSPTSIVANGLAQSTATVTVTDDNSVGVSGDTIMPSSSDSGDTFSTPVDQGNGNYTFTITSSTTAQSATITATDTSVNPTVSGSAPLAEIAGPASSASVQLSPQSILANGLAQSTATVTVLDDNGNPVSGDTITPSSSDSGDTFSTPVDQGNGNYTFTITSSTTAQSATITAADTSVNPNVSGSAPLAETGTLTQTSPTTATTTTLASSAFQPGSLAVANGVGTVSYVTVTTSPGLNVSGSGVITVTGPLLPGNYTVAGSDSDTNGDTGSWTYTLTVNAVGGGGGGGGGGGISGSTIVQTSPTTGATTTPNSTTFAPPALAVANNVGAVTYETTVPSAGLKVTPTGVISVTGSLAAGTYTVSGTDHDPSGDTGTWTYTLTVTDTFATVTFEANGGTGLVAPEKEDQPTPLTLNAFTRSHFTFIDWNTAANGAGTSYANGAAYPFTSSVTLYAQWKAGKVPFHEVNFRANGGRGTMAVERDNTATALTPVHFTRAGYTFATWTTGPSGSGANYANGATYSFKSSITLYAQWKKIPKKHKKPAPSFTVRFDANGGHGAMAPESAHATKALDAVNFTRADYTFTHWNTKPNGTGNSYANGARYSFGANMTLYAQWHHNKTVVPTAIDASGTVGPFAHKSSTLSSSLEAQISALAATVKADHDTKITLTGYGDKLSKANQLNETLWAANFALSENRASAVESYLRGRLAALDITSYSISAGGNGSAIAGSTSSSASDKYGLVVAALT